MEAEDDEELQQWWTGGGGCVRGGEMALVGTAVVPERAGEMMDVLVDEVLAVAADSPFVAKFS